MGDEDRKRACQHEARAARSQPDDKVRSGIESDDRDEAGQADRLEYPERRTGDATEEARPHGSQPAADHATEQHADAHTQSDFESSQHHRGNANHGAGHDAKCDEHHIGGVGHAIRHSDAACGVCETARRAHERDHVAALHFGARKSRDRRTGARQPAQVDASNGFFAGEISERAPVDVRTRHHHIQDRRREVEKIPVVHFAQSEILIIDLCNQQLTTACRRQRVTAQYRGRLVGFENLLAASDSLDEEARSFCLLLDFVHAPSDQRRTRLDRVGPIFDVPSRCGFFLLSALQFAFEAAALLLEVDAHESWSKLSEKPCSAHDANQVRDGKRDGDAIDHRRLVGGRQAETGNRIARGSDGRGFGQRARDDAGSGARIVGE